MSGLKVLFIGGSGVISSACSQLAVERGIDLYVLNRGTTLRRPLPEQATVLRGDIRDPASAAQALGDRDFDAVVDWVAFTPDQVQADLDLLRDRTGQYVFISSASAYQTPPARLPVLESTPLRNPFWRYSRDKIASEDLLVRAYRDEGFPATIVRPSHTYDKTIQEAAIAPGGVDVILACVGGPASATGMELLAPFGRLVVYGAASSELTALPVSSLYELRSVTGFRLLTCRAARPDQVRQAMTEVAGHAAEGRLRAAVQGTFPLAEAARAHALLEDRSRLGGCSSCPDQAVAGRARQSRRRTGRPVSGTLLTAMPATIAAAPAICGRPNGSPKTTTPTAAPTSGSRLRKGAAVAAGTRDWPKAKSANGSSVPPSARATVIGRPRAAPATGGSPSVRAATGSTATVAARNCSAVTASGSRPASSRVCATVKAAESSSDTRTSPSPVIVAPPPAAPATRQTPASDTA
ncbi:MAG TPA: zinc-binding dehydrogenase [Streptosporangiaceae bacterium]|nr:zinc-binding dehydrogenase [Streptosporangiaceae bacterium]